MKTTLALIGGIGVGICIGMLIAPDKGSKTRKKLAETTSDWFDKLSSMLSAEDEPDIAARSTHRQSAKHKL